MSAQLLTDAMPAPTRSEAAHGDARPFLSTLAAGPRERRFAMGIVLVSGLVFLSMAPFAKTPLAPMPAFLPLYQSALVVTDLLTAVLLFGQFAILGAWALLVLAGAYLFNAGMAVAHALSFPGLFAPSGLFGAGGQTTAWLYFLWHACFPLALIAYALLREREPGGARGRAYVPILGCVVLVVALVAGLYLLAAAGIDSLPALMQGDQDAPAKVFVATASWTLSLVAIPVLWRRRRPLTVLDLWLMVVLWVWVFDIALASVLNHGRYDLGWYGGRVYGLLASTFVLAVLLFEYTKLYAQVVAARQAEQRLSHASLAEKNERLRILHEIDRAIIAEAKPETIAAAALQPLRELLGARRAHVNLVDFATGEGEWLAAAGQHRMHVGRGVRFPLHMLGDLEALKRGEAQAIDVAALPPSRQRDALLASGMRHYMVVPMVAGGDLIGALSFGGENASFAHEKLTMAAETATQLAIAISQARLHERLQRKAERLRIVHDIDRAIISEVEPEAIAAAVLQPLRDLLAVPRVVVNLFDFAAGEVEWLAAAGRHHTRSGPGVRYPLRFMGDVEALKRGEVQTIDTAALPEGTHKEALLASGVRHYMAVPMIARGELIGAVSFGGETPSFPADRMAIAQEVATQLAIAISQARLLAQVRRYAEDLERKVRERTEALQIVNRELESFSYSVSHDLRAPLRAIDGYGQMLEEDYAAKLDDEGRRLLGVVREGAGQMGRLIDDLLNFSQVGRKPVARDRVDVDALVREVVAAVVPPEAKIRVEIGELPPVTGDRALLKQVWTNLVSNAVKYSGKSEQPTVQIGARREGAEQIYSVRDNGAGFDMRYYDKLFGVFQRLHRADEFEGTGVGLAIVQRIVVRHGGRVWAEGALGQGACFSFTLPAEG